MPEGGPPAVVNLNSSATWTIVAVGLSVIGYAWYLAAEQGSSTNKIVDLERRMTTIEQTGSPTLQAMRTQVQINEQRLGALETGAGKNINELLVGNATQNETIKRNTEEIGRLREWRVQETAETNDIRRQSAELRGDIIAMRSRLDIMAHWIETHQERDEGMGQTIAALKLGLDAVNARLDRLDVRLTSLLDGKNTK